MGEVQWMQAQCVARRADGSVTGCSGRSAYCDGSVEAQPTFSLHEVLIRSHGGRSLAVSLLYNVWQLRESCSPCSLTLAIARLVRSSSFIFLDCYILLAVIMNVVLDEIKLNHK